MIEFEGWTLTPPKEFENQTLWEVKLHKYHVGRAIKYKNLDKHFAITMLLSTLSKFQRTHLTKLFDATFGINGAYFKQKESNHVVTER